MRPCGATSSATPWWARPSSSGAPRSRRRSSSPGSSPATIAWCQGFSEPDAGSDLASLKTTAELDGDEWVINGQKIWTTQGFIADYVFLLCRTDKDAPKHKGISYLLCPMHQPGVEVRPITQVDGAAEFAEVFFTDARCPKDNVVGGLNNGWAVAMTTLGFERGTSATTGYRRFETELNNIIQGRRGQRRDRRSARSASASPRPTRRCRSCGSTACARWPSSCSGRKDRGVAALGATNKIFWSEYHQEVMKLAMDVLGMDSQILLGSPGEEESVPGYGRRAVNRSYPANALQSSFFFSRSETIWGGTAEIQRNIVGERVLGLPKEPKVAG